MFFFFFKLECLIKIVTKINFFSTRLSLGAVQFLCNLHSFCIFSRYKSGELHTNPARSTRCTFARLYCSAPNCFAETMMVKIQCDLEDWRFIGVSAMTLSRITYLYISLWRDTHPYIEHTSRLSYRLLSPSRSNSNASSKFLTQ